MTPRAAALDAGESRAYDAAAAALLPLARVHGHRAAAAVGLHGALVPTAETDPGSHMGGIPPNTTLALSSHFYYSRRRAARLPDQADASARRLKCGHTLKTQKVITGGKPLWLMRALVRDYSRPGDLICDPCAGGATTLIAAAIEGRRAIGAEMDPATRSCVRTWGASQVNNAPAQGERLQCEVMRWRTEPKQSSGWHVVEARDIYGAELVMTGCHLPRPGSQLEVVGEWQEYRGVHQFYARHIVSSRPSLTPDGVLRWLRDRCQGIGPQRAQALLDRFGGGAGGAAALWGALEQGPVLGVKGIDEELAQHIYDTFTQEGSAREHYATLRGWSLTQAQISRCLQHWPTAGEAVAALQRDPFQLAEHISGFGFKRADAVAKQMGVPQDSTERVCAGILYQLDELSTLGHVFGDEAFFQGVSSKFLSVPMRRTVECIRLLRDAGKVAVHDGSEVYLPELLVDEGSAAATFFAEWRHAA